MKPLPKWVGYLVAIATVVMAFGHEMLVNLLTPFLHDGANTVANFGIAVCALVLLCVHSALGTGGTAPTNDPTASTGLLDNLTSR